MAARLWSPAMGIEPQVVHLAQSGTKMTVAVAGTKVLIRHLSSDTEQLKEFHSEGDAAQGFAETLQDLAKRRWALDPEQDPNPEPLPPDTALALIPQVDKNWARVTKIKKATDLQIKDALRINGRKTDVLEPEDILDVAKRIAADERNTLHIVEGGGEILFGVAHTGAESVERLVVHTPYLSMRRQAGLELGDVSYVVSKLPNLKFALLVGGFDAVEFESSTLEELHILSDPMHSSVLSALSKANLPALHTLSLGLAVFADPDPETEAALDDFLNSDALPALKNLSIEGAEVPEDVLEKVAQSPLAARLEVLHIPDEFEDDDATTAVLNDNTAALSHLRLELDMIDDLFPKLDIYEPESHFLASHYMAKIGLADPVEPAESAE